MRAQLVAQPQSSITGAIAAYSGQLLPLTSRSLPRFSSDQTVYFAGGKGTIKNYHPESGIWIYTIEMDMGPEPDMGRIGSETTILLPEADIRTSPTLQRC